MKSISDLFLPPEISSDYYIKTLRLILDGKNNIDELIGSLGISRENVSRVISVLRKLHLIRREKGGALSLTPLGFLVLSSENGVLFLRNKFLEKFEGGRIILDVASKFDTYEDIIDKVMKTLGITKKDQNMRLRYAIKRTLEFMKYLELIEITPKKITIKEHKHSNFYVIDITNFVKDVLERYIPNSIKVAEMVIETNGNVDAKIIAALVSGALTFFISELKDE